MKKYSNGIMIGALIAFILTACGEATPTQDVNVIMTSAVSSMVASFFETQTALVTPTTPTPAPSMTPLPSPTIIYPTSTFAPLSTATFIYYSPTPGTVAPTVTLGTPGTVVTATTNPALLGSGCNNMAFIRDVTVPAGTVVKPKEDFVKIWKVQNTGTCPWLYQYRLVSISNDDFGAGEIKLQKLVEVNDWSELSAPLTAPNTPGTYTSYWRLADADGKFFGVTLVLSFDVVE